MRCRALMGAALSILVATVIGCTGPTGPGESTLDDFVQRLRQRGATVTIEPPISPNVNGFFSVPAQQLVVNGARLSAFAYASVDAAAAQAAGVTADGQPEARVRVSWISTPRFYRDGALIVLYVGCDAEIITTLNATMGAPFVIGTPPCRD